MDLVGLAVQRRWHWRWLRGGCFRESMQLLWIVLSCLAFVVLSLSFFVPVLYEWR